MFNNEFPPLGGGTGTVNKELFNILKNYPNIKIDLITSGRGKEKETELFSENIRIFKYPVNNQNIHHSSNSELIKYTIKAVFAGIAHHKKEKYYMCMAWSTVPAGFAAYLLSFFGKLPYFVRVGGPDIPGFEKRYEKLYKIITPIIKIIWKRSQFLVAKCETEKQMIHKINHKKEIKIIHNGVDTLKFKTKNFTPNEKIKLICPARLIYRKGQDTLIEAVAKLKKEGINKYQVYLIGEGDAKQDYKTLIEKHELQDNFIFEGYVEREKMPEKYREADIFVLPSHNEGMSNSLLEAMASALPVIVTKVGGTDELVDKTNGFVFDAGNSDQLYEILKIIATENIDLQLLGKNSRKIAEKNSWENIANTYINQFGQNNENLQNKSRSIRKFF